MRNSGMARNRTTLLAVVSTFLLNGRCHLSPLKLLLLQFIWILPYVLITNYLERSLLPLRFVCYTQPEFMQSPLDRDRRPPYRRTDLHRCIQHYFPGQRAPENCYMQQNFSVLIDKPLSETVKQIVIIRNAPTERGYRNHIRATWKSHFTDQNVPVIFFSGTANNPQVAAAGRDTVGSNAYIKQESEEYDDIVQMNFREAYFNLTLKMVIAYNYFLNKYPSIQRIIAINDDTIANVTSLLQIPTTSGAQIVGKVSRGYPRIFFWWLKWYIPSTMYPNWCYPTFVQGSGFVITRKAAKTIANNICSFPTFNLDDVLTGIMSDCLDISLVHYEGFDKYIPEKFNVFHNQFVRYTSKHLGDIWNSVKQDL